MRVRVMEAVRAFSAGAILLTVSQTGAAALTLQEAVAIAVRSNPDIQASVANRDAIGFELEQAEGLFLPSVDLEGRTGAQRFSSVSTRRTGDDDDVFWRNEANVVVSQLLFDGFESESEVDRQTARLEGASARVFERSEFVGLNVVREYLEVARLSRVVNLAERNIGYHRKVLRETRTGAEQGALGVADRQQAEERLYAAQARLIEFTESLNTAKIRFLRLVGEPIGLHAGAEDRLATPMTLDDALATARDQNPTIDIANAAIAAAEALVEKSESEFYPTVTIEATGRAGDDLDGVRGHETDLRLELVARWNLYRGGIDTANVDEQKKRVSEETYRLHDAHRSVEEAVRLSWETRERQDERVRRLSSQLRLANSLVRSYEEELKIGARSLLDVLDTQNTRFNTQVTLETARTALSFADYRLLASMGVLLERLGVARLD